MEDKIGSKYTTVSIERGGEAEQLLLNLVASTHREKRDIILIALRNYTQASPNAEARILQLVETLKVMASKQDGILFSRDVDIFLSMENVKLPLSEDMQSIVRKILQRDMVVDGIIIDNKPCVFYSSVLDKLTGRKIAGDRFKKA